MSEGLITIPLFWTNMKSMLGAKYLPLQYTETPDTYELFALDGVIKYEATIYKGAVPDGILAVYSQVQNDADKANFEASYKARANQPFIPTKILTTALKNGSATNMAVNGSVTPQVFVYNPPADWDIEIHTITLVAETAGAIAFGNKFIDTNLATLANGLLFEVKINDETSTWQNCKRTRDLVELSANGGFNVLSGTPNLLRVEFHVCKQLRLARAGTFANPDYVRATVRDNLNTISYLEVFMQGAKL